MDDSPNRVAVITGAARGQGRSHAVALARQEMDIVAIDRCADIASIPYALATEADLGGLQAAVDSGAAEFGAVDVVIANAGAVGMGLLDEDVFADIVDTNLRGV
jgi:NAD(P)-dependent dehydrogenase (short-subunit alcohol dehydrogenase family)